MALLTAMVTEFAYSMRTEVNITRNYKEDAQAYYLARAGVERALAELTVDYDYNNLDGEGNVVFSKSKPEAEEGAAAAEAEKAQEETSGKETPLGEGVFSFRIKDLEAKIDINWALRNRAVLDELFLQTGVKDKNTRDTIIDSMLDWVDKDDLHRLNGAEDDYYQSLNPPYTAKDERFSTVEELLLVRGVTPEIFYGTPDKDIDEGGYKGLVNYLCVSGSRKININTAPVEVLKALGYDEGRMEVLNSQLPHNSVPPLLSRFPRGSFVPTVRSERFKIIATGSAGTGEGKRVIQADVFRTGRGLRSSVKILRWDDDYYRGRREKQSSN
jgi:general secretion pathway protein K